MIDYPWIFKFLRDAAFNERCFCWFPAAMLVPIRMSHNMVGGMVQNSQSLYLFTFNALIIIHEYIYPHSTTKFTLKKYINSHLTTCFLFTNIFTRIYSFTFNGLYSFTLGSRGYFFLIDTDGSRRSRVNAEPSVSIRKKYPLEPRVIFIHIHDRNIG